MKLFLILGLIAAGIILIYYFLPIGKQCGGIAANLPQYQCSFGFECQYQDNYPDASGVCKFSPIFTFIELRNKFLNGQ